MENQPINLTPAITKIGDYLTLSRLILAAPPCYAVHVLEESFGFPQWVSANFSTTFSTGQFRRNNLLFFTMTILLSIIACRSSRRIVLLGFFTWCSGLFLHNVLFHVGATLFFRDFSPGLVSSLFIYLPFWLLLLKSIRRERCLNNVEIIGALIAGGTAHFAFIVVDLLT